MPKQTYEVIVSIRIEANSEQNACAEMENYLEYVGCLEACIVSAHLHSDNEDPKG
jgi:hypothetical protein